MTARPIDVLQLARRSVTIGNGQAPKMPIEGSADPHYISTSFVERQTLLIRMSIRGFIRLTNAFSNKIEKHALSVALHSMHDNFARIQKALRISPAMAAA